NFCCPKKRPLPTLRPRTGPVSREQLGALLQGHAEGEEDPALGLHPAVVAGLDPVDGRFGDPGFPCQLCFRHQRRHAKLLYLVHTTTPEPNRMGTRSVALRACTMSPTRPRSIDHFHVGSQGTDQYCTVTEGALTVHFTCIWGLKRDTP